MSDMVSNFNRNKTNASDNASGIGNNYFSARHRSNMMPEGKEKKSAISRNKYATNFNSSIVSGERSEQDNFSVSNYNKS